MSIVNHTIIIKPAAAIEAIVTTIFVAASMFKIDRLVPETRSVSFHLKIS